MMIKKFLTILCVTVGLVSATSASAQNTALIDVFGNWSAFAVKQGGNPVCYIGSVPIKSTGKYSKRGDVLLMVTHRPADKQNGVVNFQAGYSFKVGTDVQLTIGQNAYTLFTSGQDAWATDPKSDKAIVLSMIKGSTLIVKGVSARGTQTTDSFSLKGFTAAYKAASKACHL